MNVDQGSCMSSKILLVSSCEWLSQDKEKTEIPPYNNNYYYTVLPIKNQHSYSRIYNLFRSTTTKSKKYVTVIL